MPLVVVVGGVMASFAIWALIQRERTMVSEARRETQAYATALGLALEGAFQDPDRGAVPHIVERISLQPSVYGVVVYDLAGRPAFGPGASAVGADFSPPDEVRRILSSGGTSEFERTQDGVDVYSVVRPIMAEDGSLAGAFEVLQPLSFVQEEMGRTRVRFALNTFVLLAALSLLLVALVRRLVSEPLAGFAEAVRALGTGQLDRRVVGSGPRISELASIAGELNRMAASLETAQTGLIHESEERLALERELRRTEKMALVGQLAAGLAHEIGAPLHVIRGRADLLLAGAERTPADARHLRLIAEQIDRITRIVRNLLDFARHGEPSQEVVDLVPIVDGVLELLAIEFEQADIEARRSGMGAAHVIGDRDQLQQVVLNLLLNASQAIGEVSGARTIDVRIGRSGERARDHVAIEIQDSGPGIPDELQERIFDPFFTTRSERAGTGLGLAVARWIVEAHHGQLLLAPRHAPGTAFVIILPSYAGADHGG